MPDLSTRQENAGVRPQDPRSALVERIAASSQFQKAPQLCRILRYVAARSLTETPVAISEKQIGLTVLGRGHDFDPNQDNIVRVQMRHLRSKLEEYFSGEGHDEPVVLTIPKGCYLARFEPRPTAAPTPEAQTHNGSGQPAASASVPLYRRLSLIAPGAIVIAIAVTLFVSRQNSETVPRGTALPVHASADYAFYQDLLGSLGKESPSETRLVLSNPKLMVYVGSPSAQWREGTRAVPVPSELAPKLAPAMNHRDEGLPYYFIRMTDQDYTGIGEATSCFYLGQLMQILRRRLGLTQARFLNWDSVRNQNLIIVGSPDINEWAYQNIAKRNYSIEKPGIRNEKPGPGEQSLYQVVRSPQNGGVLVDYALIWMSTYASGSHLLVLAGCTSPGTAGVGTFFADPDRMRPVYDKLKSGGTKGQFPSDWQVVLKVNIRDNLPIETTYVSHRVYSATP